MLSSKTNNRCQTSQVRKEICEVWQNQSSVYRHLKGFFRTEVVLKIKIENFYLQNNFGPIDFLLARLFFRRKKQCVVSRKFVMHPRFVFHF